MLGLGCCVSEWVTSLKSWPCPQTVTQIAHNKLSTVHVTLIRGGKVCLFYHLFALTLSAHLSCCPYWMMGAFKKRPGCHIAVAMTSGRQSARGGGVEGAKGGMRRQRARNQKVGDMGGKTMQMWEIKQTGGEDARYKADVVVLRAGVSEWGETSKWLEW